MLDLSFDFVAECWLWSGEKAAWHFITLPKDKSEEIQFFDKNMHEKRRGWGAVKVLATIGNTSWETSIFPSASVDAYILPIKADVRKKEKIVTGKPVKVQLKIKL